MSLITSTPQFGPPASTRFSVKGIRFAEGEGGGAPAEPPAATPPVVTPPAEVKPPWGDDPTKFDPDKAWALIQNVKTDLATEKTKRDDAIAAAVKKASEDTQKATLAQFAKLLGGGEEEETDPAKLAAKIAEQNGTITKTTTDLASAQMAAAVALLAPGLGANAALLLKNEDFKTSIASAVPTDEAALTSAITKALQANAALKATPPRSGSGEHQGATVQTLEAQLAAATEKKDFVETIRLKQALAAARKA